jgi:hypothetical protein
MHPDFLQMTLDNRQDDLDRQVQRAFLRRSGSEAPPTPTEDVVLRLCSVRDDCDLERLAALEGRPAPSGWHVVAEVGGTIVAALPLGSGAALADPFRATAHLLPLLEMRARQLSAARRGRGFGLLHAVRLPGRA